MSFLHSAIAQRNLRIRSKHLTQPFQTAPIASQIVRAVLKRIASIELWYRRQRKLRPEEFYQTHVNAIFLGMYVEMVLGVAAGIVSVLSFGMPV